MVPYRPQSDYKTRVEIMTGGKARRTEPHRSWYIATATATSASHVANTGEVDQPAFSRQVGAIWFFLAHQQTASWPTITEM
jgi:hypothetical protein